MSKINSQFSRPNIIYPYKFLLSILSLTKFFWIIQPWLWLFAFIFVVCVVLLFIVHLYLVWVVLCQNILKLLLYILCLLDFIPDFLSFTQQVKFRLMGVIHSIFILLVSNYTYFSVNFWSLWMLFFPAKHKYFNIPSFLWSHQPYPFAEL